MATKLRWLTNVENPRFATAADAIPLSVQSPEEASNNAFPSQKQSQEEAHEQRKQWLRGKFIGLPKATDNYTVKQLIDMGMVGVYTSEEEDPSDQADSEIAYNMIDSLRQKLNTEQ